MKKCNYPYTLNKLYLSVLANFSVRSLEFIYVMNLFNQIKIVRVICQKGNNRLIVFIRRTSLHLVIKLQYKYVKQRNCKCVVINSNFQIYLAFVLGNLSNKI